jgi:hypothetical protein
MSIFKRKNNGIPKKPKVDLFVLTSKEVAAPRFLHQPRTTEEIYELMRGGIAWDTDITTEQSEFSQYVLGGPVFRLLLWLGLQPRILALWSLLDARRLAQHCRILELEEELGLREPMPKVTGEGWPHYFLEGEEE